jgi:hypothetical protein
LIVAPRFDLPERVAAAHNEQDVVLQIVVVEQTQ